jgi:hypothetical protein
VTEIDCNKLTMITKLTMFTSKNNVIITLVAHPIKKCKRDNGLYNSPSLYDASGSPDFETKRTMDLVFTDSWRFRRSRKPT